MKKKMLNKIVVAAIALLIFPAALIAQTKKDEKEKKEMQTIVITRHGNNDKKTVIEIDGDKVKINGKDAKDNNDVSVNITTMNSMGNMYRFKNRAPGSGSWNMNLNGDQMSLFSEDANRAMLGVVTEGNDKGAQIQSVTKESAAEKAGLKKGDIITKVGDKKIETTDDVTEAIHAHKPGDKITIGFLRDGKSETVTAELGKWKGIKMNEVTIPRIADLNREWNIMPPEGPMMFENNFAFGGRPRLGLSIQDTDDGNGVKVLNVEEESNAAKAGIKKDDIITAIDDKDVKNTDDITRTLRENRDKYTFTFKVKRDGKMQTIAVKIPRKLKTADL